MSKNEQKRRLKEEKLAKEKAEKEAKKALLEKDKPKKEKEVEITDPTKYYENRSKKI